jgi:Family of unknown function (DUF6152)
VKNSYVFALLLISGFVVNTPALFAHHGNASFDTDKKLTMKATVTEWFWANPHCFLKFDVTDEKGNVVHWTAETSNPSDMANLGWSNQTFKPGDQISVTLQPVKNGHPIGRVTDVVLPNGQTLGTRPAGLPVPGLDPSKATPPK